MFVAQMTVHYTYIPHAVAYGVVVEYDVIGIEFHPCPINIICGVEARYACAALGARVAYKLYGREWSHHIECAPSPQVEVVCKTVAIGVEELEACTVSLYVQTYAVALG